MSDSQQDSPPNSWALQREAAREGRHAAAAAAAARLGEMGGGLAPLPPKPPPAASSRAKRRRRGAAASGLPLPDDLALRILSCLADDLRATGGAVVGPCDAARDIASAALSCRGFSAAARDAFNALTDAVAAATAAGTSSGCDGLVRSWNAYFTAGCAHENMIDKEFSWAEWEEVLAAPARFHLPDLKRAAHALRVKVGGTKAEVIVRMLDALGLPGPARLPVRLWRACALDCRVSLATAGKLSSPVPPAFKRLVAAGLDLKDLLDRGLDVRRAHVGRCLATAASEPAASEPAASEPAVSEPAAPEPAAAPPPLTSALTLAEARAALLARGVRTAADLDALAAALERVLRPKRDGQAGPLLAVIPLS